MHLALRFLGGIHNKPVILQARYTANGVLMKPIVLVTGGSRGIGAATSKYLAKQNYAVCVNYISNKIT
jgi:hypothetical protein